MGLMSFQHLKGKSAREIKKEPITQHKLEPVKEPVKKAAAPPQVIKEISNRVELANSGLWDKTAATQGINETNFCYGCDRFSIDAPDTQKEKRWCARYAGVDRKFSWEFKEIKNIHKIGQCPLVANGTRKL